MFDRFVEKGNLEVQLFILTSKLRANHQKMYIPPEGRSMVDINRVRINPSILKDLYYIMIAKMS